MHFFDIVIVDLQVLSNTIYFFIQDLALELQILNFLYLLIMLAVDIVVQSLKLFSSFFLIRGLGH